MLLRYAYLIQRNKGIQNVSNGTKKYQQVSNINKYRKVHVLMTKYEIVFMVGTNCLFA